MEMQEQFFLDSDEDAGDVSDRTDRGGPFRG